MGYIFVNGSRVKDLTNMKFSKLTAKSPTGTKDRYATWLCECECGNTCTATSKKLSQNRKRDYGCGISKKARRTLVGQVFNHLEVVKLVKDGARQIYLCKCLLCGNMHEVDEKNLVSGSVKSCGCIRQKNITGLQFGELIAIRSTKERKNGSLIWEFECSCGSLCYYTPSQVAAGFRSCGCLREIEKSQNTKLQIVKNPGKLRSDNKSGYPGVMLTKDGKWQVTITFQKRHYYLGRYIDKDKAIEVRKLAENRLYGDFMDWYENEFKKEKNVSPSHYD